jgi:hypothetical protein
MDDLATNSVFPKWVHDGLENYEKREWFTHYDAIRDFLENFSKLVLLLRQAPPKAMFFEMVPEITPRAAEETFGDAGVGLLHAAEGATAAWTSTHIYKLRAYCEGMLDALEKGNLLVAASCARAIFEHAACFHFFFIKIEENRRKGKQLAQMQRKNIRKGNNPPSDWIDKAMRNLLEHIQICYKSVSGGDFDWKKYLDSIATPEAIDLLNEKQPTNQNSSFSGKTHTNKCIEKLPKIERGFVYWYGALCDLVHPNIGSNFMVTDVRESHSQFTVDTTVTDLPKNGDAIFWLISVIAIPLGAICNLTQNEILVSNEIAKEYQSMAISSAGNKWGQVH